MATVYYLILVPMVYCAFAVFVAGTLIQGARVLCGFSYSMKTAVGPQKKPGFLGAMYEAFLFPAAFRASPVHWFILIVFHILLLFLLAGHIELIGEVGFLQIIEHEVFLGGGVIGIALVLILVFFLFRRFHSPVREISEPMDFYILIILILAVLFGSQLHLARRLFGYDTVSVAEYRQYLSGIFTFRPVLPEYFTDADTGHTFLLVLHVFFANVFLMLLPFSRILHFLLSFPLKRLQRN